MTGEHAPRFLLDIKAALNDDPRPAREIWNSMAEGWTLATVTTGLNTLVRSGIASRQTEPFGATQRSMYRRVNA